SLPSLWICRQSPGYLIWPSKEVFAWSRRFLTRLSRLCLAEHHSFQKTLDSGFQWLRARLSAATVSRFMEEERDEDCELEVTVVESGPGGRGFVVRTGRRRPGAGVRGVVEDRAVGDREHPGRRPGRVLRGAREAGESRGSREAQEQAQQGDVRLPDAVQDRA